jgi:hypothetical protein
LINTGIGNTVGIVVVGIAVRFNLLTTSGTV